MFKVSENAATQIKRSLSEHEFDDMPIRVAARQAEDGSIEYQMGFDEAGPGDTMIASRGVDVVIARDHLILLNGTEMDYVKLDDGDEQFIFLNPNDPTFVPPKEAGHEYSGDDDSSNG